MKFALAGIGGIVLGVLIAGAIAASNFSERRQSAEAGWKPVKTLVFAQELRTGAKIAAADLMVRPLPEQFVTASFIRQDEAAKVIGRVLGAPVMAGDPVTWQHFDLRTAEINATACAKAITESVKAAEAATVEQAVRDFESRRGVPEAPASLPAIPRDAEGGARVIVAGKDLPEGTLLTEELLSQRTLPAYLVTRSLIPYQDSGAIIGARVIVPLQAGDPVLWQQLDDPASPVSAASCAFDVAKAAEATRAKVAAERAAAYFTEVSAP